MPAHLVLPEVMGRLTALQGWRAGALMVVCGALSALALPPLHLLPVLLLTFPLLVAFAARARNWRAAFGYGYGFGFGFHTLGLYWLVNAVLLRAHDFWWLVPIVSPACAVLLAVLPGACCALYHALGRRCGVFIGLVFFAGVWTLLDMSRAICLPPLWWNPVLTGFPWNPLGSGWAVPGAVGDIMLQPAAWVGGDGLTLLTVVLALLPLTGRRGWRLALGGVMLWAAAGGLRLWLAGKPPEGHNPVVVLVQGNVPEQVKLSRGHSLKVFESYLRLTHDGVARARKRFPDPGRAVVFAWPESAFPALLQYDELSREQIARQMRPPEGRSAGADVGFVGTLSLDRNRRWRNSLMALLPPDGQIAAVYDKVHLVPFGEYQPALVPFHLVPGGGLAAGERIKTLHIAGISPVGPLICYEVIFSAQVTDPDDRPSWLLNITNDGWYGNSAGPRQHLAAVRMRAVEEGLPIARAANTGISAAYDPYGHELARLGWDVTGGVVASLPDALPPTLFARLGRSVPAGLALACAALALVCRRGRKTP